MKQIIAIGGGGFGREIKDLKIEKYIIEQCSKQNPSVCFIPTATGDDANYIQNFYKVFNALDCNTSHIDFFKRTISLEEHINQQDIIFVGGGNTKSMLAVWKEWGLDSILHKAYQNGTIMSGVSAGAICWFKNGITDSWKEHQAVLPCLGFVEGNCCPHYDEEPERIPFVKQILENNMLDECLAIEGLCALHIIDDIPKFTVSFGEDKNSYQVCCKDKKIIHNQISNIDKIQL
ncbi:MAG: Type 1 glutamine amidotransferase-like domain-containing protein [Gammaproteobacteria bacterium]|tara:strand:- start:12560 stop:13258 length:699 start_codon:yes stop_codon:yes gene_type:complete